MTSAAKEAAILDGRDPDEIPSNPTVGPDFRSVAERRFGRRGFLAGAGALAAIGLTGRAAFRDALAATTSLTFTEVAADADVATHHVAPGYRADVLIRWGDAVVSGAAPFDVARQTPEAQRRQFGYNCDWMTFMPLPQGSQSSDRGLLWVNHEYTTTELMFPGLTAKDKIEKATQEMALVEIAAHGGSLIEVARSGGKWAVVAESGYARRVAADSTAIRVSGPAAGSDRLKTSADVAGTQVLGMLNNCAGGVTPWGTVLTCEENFNGYFGGKLPAGHAEAAAYKRYGIVEKSWYSWPRHFDRFDLAKEPNEPNRFGWVVEIDPYDPASQPVKRTAMGRFKHEGASSIVNGDGRVVFYMGDDERFDYVYKFVTAGRFNPNDRAANRDLLDDGTLYVARFHDDGRLTWLPLVHGQGPLVAANGFQGQGDVVIEARRAADLVGATPMDRPEDVEVNHINGRIYVALTNNSQRQGADGADAARRTNAANPRPKNIHGQVVEIVPIGTDPKAFDHAATEARWDMFAIAGNPAKPEDGAKYGGEVSAAGWLSCPDMLEVDPQGRLWIGTDGMNASSKRVDGLYAAETAGPARGVTRLFYACPSGAELCGPTFTPDGRTLFVAIQHPGEDNGLAADAGSSFDKPGNRWPDFDPALPPRPSVVVITQVEGKEIGA